MPHTGHADDALPTVCRAQVLADGETEVAAPLFGFSPMAPLAPPRSRIGTQPIGPISCGTQRYDAATEARLEEWEYAVADSLRAALKAQGVDAEVARPPLPAGGRWAGCLRPLDPVRLQPTQHTAPPTARPKKRRRTGVDKSGERQANDTAGMDDYACNRAVMRELKGLPLQLQHLAPEMEPSEIGAEPVPAESSEMDVVGSAITRARAAQIQAEVRMQARMEAGVAAADTTSSTAEFISTESLTAESTTADSIIYAE
eukprot:gene56595-17024_t